jgi:hypothetical protein
MPARQDEWYETATREIAEKNLAASAWGRAFSEALGNPQVALALYIKLRVEQLEREFHEKQGANYCAKCDRTVEPSRRRRDWLVAVFSGKPEVYYVCPICERALERVRIKTG